MPDVTDDSKTRPFGHDPLADTPGVYSSLDAPPPPFQLRAPGRTNEPPRSPMTQPRTPSSAGGRRSTASGRRPRVKPAAVRLEAPPAPPLPRAAPAAEPLRPEALPEDATNPGAVVAVTVSLLVSAMVFLLAV